MQLGPRADRSFPLCPGNSPPNHLQTVEKYQKMTNFLEFILDFLGI